MWTRNSCGLSVFTLDVCRARNFKPFKEPRNRFPVWRNRFLGIDCWAGIFKESMGAKNRVEIGVVVPARQAT